MQFGATNNSFGLGDVIFGRFFAKINFEIIFWLTETKHYLKIFIKIQDNKLFCE